MSDKLWEGIMQLLPFLLPFVFGWLLKSPVAKYIPHSVGDVLERLQPDDIQGLIAKYGTKQARRETAIEMLQGELSERGIDVEYNTAGDIVTYFEGRYKDLVKKLGK